MWSGVPVRAKNQSSKRHFLKSKFLPDKWYEVSETWSQVCYVVAEDSTNSKSQNHRTVGVGRDLCGSPSPTPCWSRVTQSRLHRTLFRRGLNISREGDSTTSLGCLGQGSVTLIVKKFFLLFSWNFLCFSLCPFVPTRRYRSGKDRQERDQRKLPWPCVNLFSKLSLVCRKAYFWEAAVKNFADVRWKTERRSIQIFLCFSSCSFCCKDLGWEVPRLLLWHFRGPPQEGEQEQHGPALFPLGRAEGRGIPCSSAQMGQSGGEEGEIWPPSSLSTCCSVVHQIGPQVGKNSHGKSLSGNYWWVEYTSVEKKVPLTTWLALTVINH